MTRARWLLVGGMVVVSVMAAFFLRRAVYDLIVVPLAYLWWLAKIFYSAIPQLVLWTALIVVLFLAILWNFMPTAESSRRPAPKRKPAEGQVEALAVWFLRARKGNYFKWQLANRLGRLAHRLNETSWQRSRRASRNEAVEQYLEAGLNYSFMDFPASNNRFRRAAPTPLDLNPGEVVDYLESQVEMGRGSHT